MSQPSPLLPAPAVIKTLLNAMKRANPTVVSDGSVQFTGLPDEAKNILMQLKVSGNSVVAVEAEVLTVDKALKVNNQPFADWLHRHGVETERPGLSVKRGI